MSAAKTSVPGIWKALGPGLTTGAATLGVEGTIGFNAAPTPDAVFAKILAMKCVLHGVTSIAPLDPGLDAVRDVLVVTFRRDEPTLGAYRRAFAS